MLNTRLLVVASAAVAAVSIMLWSPFNHGAAQQARLAADGTSAQPATKAEAEAQKPSGPTSYSLTDDENETRIEQELKKSTTFNFDEKPLKDALDDIAKKHAINVQIDEKALTDQNVPTDTPITRNVRDISLESALRLMLRPVQLTHRIGDGVLQITTQQEADSRLEIRIYPVGDLVTPLNNPEFRDGADYDRLIDIITSTIAPTTWDEVGGPGSVEAFGESLIISQAQEVHAKIEPLVAGLRKLRIAQKQHLGGPGVDLTPDERADAIGKALSKSADLEFDEIPLKLAIEFIAKKHDINIQIDDKPLSDLNVPTDTPITRNVHGIPLRSALRLMLRPLELTYIVRDEVLLITTQQEADAKLPVRLYPVRDLLECDSTEDPDYGRGSCDFDALADLIQATLAPTSWSDVGGPSEIREYEGALALVINQTEEVHQQIDAMLARLRNVRETQKQAATSGTAKKDEFVMRVYALWQVDRQRERHADPAQARAQPSPAAVSDNSNTRESVLRQTPSVGGGGTRNRGIGGSPLSEQYFDATPPPGVPAEQAAALIRRLVAPESWNKPGVMLQPTSHRLLISQTRAAHRKIAELLAQLGPWREVCSADNPCAGGGTGGLGFGGAFQVADDPFAPRPANAPGADPFAPPRPTPAADPFGAPPDRPRAADPFGPEPAAAADPFGAPQQGPANPFGPGPAPANANGRQAKRNGENQPAERAPAERPRTPRGGAPEAAQAKARKLAAQFAGHDPSAAEERIRAELNTETDVEFNEVPLKMAIEYIKDKHQIEIRLDEKGLKEATIAVDTPLTINVKGISLRSALKQMLSELPNDPTFVIRDDVLVITSRERASQFKLLRIYNVSDLCEDTTLRNLEPQPGYGRPPREQPHDELNSLANVVQQAIAPGTWEPAQGNSVVPLISRRTPILVVRHSALAHEEVAALLRSLRDVQERQREAQENE